MKNFNVNWKMVLFLLLSVAAAPLFAQNLVPQGLTKISDEIVAVFTGGLVRGILIACLAGCGVAYGFNKDNESMKKKVIAIAIAIVIIICASGIVDAIMTAAK